MAAKLQAYFDRGCDLICPYDLLPAGLSSLEQMATPFRNQLGLRRIQKENNTPKASPCLSAGPTTP